MTTMTIARPLFKYGQSAKNRSIFGKDVGKYMMTRFYGPKCRFDSA